jgi:hypothetical protein
MNPEPELNERPLSPQVREILEELFEVDAQELYTEGARVMSSGEFRARYVMVAATVREIMDLIEAAAGYEHRPPDSRRAIANLEQAWRVAQQTETGEGGGVTAFEATLEEFFKRFRNVPPRRDLAIGTLQHFDPTMRDASPVVQGQRVKRWADLREFFNLVVHRKTFPSSLDFEERLETFEQFLIRWLRPPTSADQHAIDALLREGPPSD